MSGKLPDIVKTITLNAPIEKVWDTVATAEKIAAWFMPNDFQPIEGHEFTIQSPFGPSPCKVER
ncbi:MAG TPA: SRPBCC domain-containing protein, partial [Lysinibacillus sp.]|nr:SRPBCC domain-containing protein [Lysinibacillus sp.]